MRYAYVAAILICGGLLVSGCGASDPLDRYHLGEAKEIVGVCMDTMGGLRAWQKVRSVSASAVVSTYDEDGRACVNRYRLKIDFRADKVTARARTGYGRWRAVVSAGGKCKLSVSGRAGEEVNRRRLGLVLAMILHRVRGPLNLLGGDEHVVGAMPARLGGSDVVRVIVTGDTRYASAYYFDAGSGLLQFVTRGADAAGGNGTVTIYTYENLPSGMAFPRRLRVVKIGQRAMLSDTPVLDVEFDDITIHTRLF